MSNSLKERLKKSSIYAMSPISSKRFKSAEENGTGGDDRLPNKKLNLSADPAQEENDNDRFNSETADLSQAYAAQGITSTVNKENCESNTNFLKSGDVSEDGENCETSVKHSNCGVVTSFCENCKDCDRTQNQKDADVNLTLQTNVSTVLSNSNSLNCEQGSKETNTALESLKKQKGELLDSVNKKEDLVRKLKMVKMYRTKNDLNDLEELTERWLTVCQQALEEMVEIAPEPKPTIHQLLQHLNIDPTFVRYDPESECFV